MSTSAPLADVDNDDSVDNPEADVEQPAGVRHADGSIHYSDGTIQHADGTVELNGYLFDKAFQPKSRPADSNEERGARSATIWRKWLRGWARLTYEVTFLPESDA